MDKSVRIVLALAAWSQMTGGPSCGGVAYESHDSYGHHYPRHWHDGQPDWRTAREIFTRDVTHEDFSENENEDNSDENKDKEYWHNYHQVDWHTDKWSGNKGESDWTNQGLPNTWNLNKPMWNNQGGGWDKGNNNWNNQGNNEWANQDNNNGWNNQGVPNKWNNQDQANNWNQGGSNSWNNQNRPNSWNNQNNPNSWNNQNTPWNNQGGANNWNNGNNQNRPNSWNSQGGTNNWNNQFDTGNGNNQGSPTRVPQTSTPASPTPMSLETTQCIRNCPVTPEYNPVCGSNNVTYGNIGRLECAKFCGVDVTIQRSAPCPLTSIQNNQNPVTTNPNNDVEPTIATQPTERPNTNVDFTISPDILNSIFTTTEADDNVDIDIRTKKSKSYVQHEIVYPAER